MESYTNSSWSCFVSQDVSQAAQALPLALKATTLASLSEGQGLLTYFERAHVQLARVQVAFRASDRALHVLDHVWPDILSSRDMELIANAKKVRADCLARLVDQLREDKEEVDEADENAALEEAAQLLEDAQSGFESLSAPHRRVAILAELAKLRHRQGKVAERDAVAKQWRAATKALQDDGRGEKDMMRKVCEVERLCAIVSGRTTASL